MLLSRYTEPFIGLFNEQKKTTFVFGGLIIRVLQSTKRFRERRTLLEDLTMSSGFLPDKIMLMSSAYVINSAKVFLH